MDNEVLELIVNRNFKQASKLLQNEYNKNYIQHGNCHIKTLVAQNNLGTICALKNNYSASSQCYKAVLNTNRFTNHIKAIVLHNYGTICLKNYHLRKAKILLKSAIQIWDSVSKDFVTLYKAICYRNLIEFCQKTQTANKILEASSEYLNDFADVYLNYYFHDHFTEMYRKNEGTAFLVVNENNQIKPVLANRIYEFNVLHDVLEEINLKERKHLYEY